MLRGCPEAPPGTSGHPRAPGRGPGHPGTRALPCTRAPPGKTGKMQSRNVCDCTRDGIWPSFVPGAGRCTRAQEQNRENATSYCLRLPPRRHFPSFVPAVGRCTHATPARKHAHGRSARAHAHTRACKRARARWWRRQLEGTPRAAMSASSSRARLEGDVSSRARLEGGDVSSSGDVSEHTETPACQPAAHARTRTRADASVPACAGGKEEEEPQLPRDRGPANILQFQRGGSGTVACFVLSSVGAPVTAPSCVGARASPGAGLRRRGTQLLCDNRSPPPG